MRLVVTSIPRNLGKTLPTAGSSVAAIALLCRPRLASPTNPGRMGLRQPALYLRQISAP